jgi:hypothetical protein
MEQGNIDTGSNATIIGLVILGALLFLGTLFINDDYQKVYINPNFEVSTDTISTEESRWYYVPDSSVSNIRIALFKEKAFHPYDVVYLSPDDYIDLRLEEGYNIVSIKTLEKEYPKLNKKVRILQLKPDKDSNSITE